MPLNEKKNQTIKYHLNFTARKYKMTISSTKKKSKAMLENHIQRVKIVIKSNTTEQATSFK